MTTILHTTLRIAALGCAGLAAATGAGTAQAQTADQQGQLSNWANQQAPNAGTRSVAYAVQGMCNALAAEGGHSLAAGNKRDLFLRCNEAVASANSLLLGQTVGRSMGFNRTEMTALVQQVSGEELNAQASLSTQVSSGQFANISGRLNALRVGGGSAAARGRVAQLRNSSATSLLASNTAAPRLGGGASSDRVGIENRLGWFMESNYGFGDHDQTANEDAFDFDSLSLTTGTDYNFGSGILGFALGYDRYNAEFDRGLVVSGGEVEVNGLSGSLFGALFRGPWSLNAIATYGSLESDLSRNVSYTSNIPTCALGCGAERNLTGSPDGDYVALGATFAMDFAAGGWEFTPSLSASYRDISIDGFTENDTSGGGLALAYDDQSIESKRAIAGLAIARPISRAFGVLTPMIRIEFHHEFEDDARTVQAKYALESALTTGGSAANDFGCTRSCFSISSEVGDSNFGVGSLGVSAVFTQRLQAYAFYERLLGTDSFNSNSVAVGVRGQF